MMNKLKAVHTKMSPDMIQLLKVIMVEQTNPYNNTSEFVRIAVMDKLESEFPEHAIQLGAGDVYTDKRRQS